jgi:hypothetical protein
VDPKPEEIALLLKHEWWREQFVARDSVRYTPRGYEVVKKGGWDHEHCQLCMDVISARDPARRWGYRNDDDDWLCEACYRLYLKPRGRAA